MTNRKPKPTDKPANTAVSQSQAILETRKSELWQGVTYQLQRRRKGQYWYAFWHDATAGKTKSKYIGKLFRELNEDDFF